MDIYTGQARVKTTPASSYFAQGQLQTATTFSWSYSECVKQWFRVEGACFTPPPTATCPPFPRPVSGAASCVPQDLLPLPTLFNTGLADDRSLLAVCANDNHVLVLPSQLPFVVDYVDVPGGTSAPTASSQYVGVDCNGKSAPDEQFTFRIPFVCPANVDPQTLKITLVIDSPCTLVDIVKNNVSTGFNSSPPVNAKQFELISFQTNVNTIDLVVAYYLPPLAIPPFGGVPVSLMVRFTSILGCVGSGNGPGDAPVCKFNYKNNVRACNAEDVCRILKENGQIFPITSISIPNSSFDSRCYIDVTPTLNDCVECCDFLIDENRQQDIFGNAFVYELYEYTGIGAISGAASSSASIVLVYNGGASISGRPDSSQYVIYGAPPPMAFVSVWALSGTGSSFYSFSGFGSVVPTPETSTSSSSFWSYTGIGSISGNPQSGVTGTAYAGSSAFVRVFAGSATTPVYNSLAKIVGVGKTSGGVTNVLYTGMAKAAGTASSIFGASFLEYFGIASVKPSAASQVQWEWTGFARASLRPSTGLYAIYNYAGIAKIKATGATTVAEAPVWIWNGVAEILPTPVSTYTSSDIGLFLAEGDVGNMVLNEINILLPVPSSPLVVNFPDLNLTGCCSSIAQDLQFRHNLGSIPKFANFLIRNGLAVPGQLVRGRSETFIPLPYSVRSGGWVANLHLDGLSTSDPGPEQWNIAVTAVCSGGYWMLGLRVLRTITGLSEVLRLTVAYTQPQFCPTATGFTGFSYAVDTRTQASAPAASSVVFHDEAGWTILSPSSLNFIISDNNGPVNTITQIASLNSQLQAANALL